jgi:hypothetical protein
MKARRRIKKTPVDSITRAVAALVEIMRDEEQSPRQRIEACEHLLDYECPPAVIDEAKAALLSIVEAGETSTDTNLAALKLMRRCEAKRVSPGRATSQGDAKIQLAVELLRRRTALLRAGIVSRMPPMLACLARMAPCLRPRPLRCARPALHVRLSDSPSGCACNNAWSAPGKQAASWRAILALRDPPKPQQWRTPSVTPTAGACRDGLPSLN